MKHLSMVFALLLMAFSAAALAAEPIATLRGGAALTDQPAAPVMPKVSNKDLRRTRNYPEQPPTIPHKIDGYQIDLNVNKCLTCHARSATAQSQAPMVSITHFMDRDGQFLASISTRRYFCSQCHVPQLEVAPLVENDFEDIDSLLARLRKESAGE